MNSQTNRENQILKETSKNFDKVKSTKDYVKQDRAMEFHDYVESLQGDLEEILGLDDLEVKTYLTLLRTGPITASALAKDLDVDRARMYRTVEKLVSQNILSTTLSIPKLCIPLEPKKAFELALRKKEDEVKKIKKTGHKLIQKIEEGANISNGTNVPTFRVIQGRSNIYSDIAQMIEKSSVITYIVTDLEDVSKMYHTAIPEKISISKKNGGIVRLLVDKDEPEMLTFIKRLKATENRVCKLPSKGRMVIQENNQMILSDSGINRSSRPTDFEFSLCTNSSEMISNLYNYCELLWDSAEPI